MTQYGSMQSHGMNVLAHSTLCLRSIVLGLFLLSLTPLRGQAPLESEPFEIVKLLVSSRAEEVAKGEQGVAEKGPRLIEQLLERIRSKKPEEVREAAEALGVVMSPWLRGKEVARRAQLRSPNYQHPRPPIGRVSLPEAGEIRETLQAAILALLRGADGSPVQNPWLARSLQSLCKTLGEVANDATLDLLMHELQRIESPTLAEPLISLADTYLGIPPVFRCSLLCGNCTAAEVKAFEHSEKVTFVKARSQISQQWAQVRELETRGRVAFAIQSWRAEILRQQATYSAVADNGPWVLWKMESLVRLGAAAVEGVRAQHAVETEERLRWVWGFVISALTGELEPPLSPPVRKRRELIGVDRSPSPDP